MVSCGEIVFFEDPKEELIDVMSTMADVNLAVNNFGNKVTISISFFVGAFWRVPESRD